MFQHLKCTSLLIIGFLIAAVYVVKLVELLNVDYDLLSNSSHVEYEQWRSDVKTSTDKLKNVGMGDETHHLMWFIQISDLHISSFMDPTRIATLNDFCGEVIPAIKPSVVLASGDLTDGRTPDKFGSGMFEEEWRIYKEIIHSTGVLRHTNWLDIRGNHDNFGVASINNTKNYFRRYSVQGVDHPRSYLFQIKKGYDKYSFIAVDACLDPGPKRPFNFYGLLTDKEMRALYEYDEVAQTSSNSTIWFGHYPTSSILSPSPGIRHLMRNGVAYLCGHFHNMGGWIPHMYSFQKTGFLELELGDWKDSRIFRVGAMDHGLFSFVDVKYLEWPIILITNPKPALFLVPGSEPNAMMTESTHIRVLVFSPSTVAHVAARIDDGSWMDCQHVEGPLYVLPWNPQLYAAGLHEISVIAKDSDGRIRTVSHMFSMDGSRLTFALLARILLMSNLNVAAQVILGLSVCIAVLPLCWVRVMYYYVKAGKVSRPRYSMTCIYAVMRKMWLIATIDRIFYPVMFMTIYVPLGPWFVGDVIDNYTGVCFAWGMFVNGSYLPGGHTFLFAVIRIWTFNIPLMWLLARCLDNRYRNLNGTPKTSFIIYTFRQMLMILFFIFNAFVAYLTIPTYGVVAFLINPVVTWSLLGAVVLWQVAIYAPDKCFRHLMPIFPIRKRLEAEETPLKHYKNKDEK